MNVFVKTFGCTFNKADSDAICELLKTGLSGICFTEREAADVVVVNSCSVKDATAQKILCELSSLAKAGKKVVVCGCLAQTSPDLVRKAHPQASLVGTKALCCVAQAVSSASVGCREEFLGGGEDFLLKVVVDGVVARVQIAVGCTGACTYCSAKLARGRVRSFFLAQLKREVEKAVLKGALEVQLTAQDTGCYGFDLTPRKNLADLLDSLCSVEGEFRIRVGMMNPNHALKFLPELLEAFSSKKVYKFLHVPVQSGSNKVLKDMNRSYAVEDFEKVVRTFRERFPGITIATDFIVGYPTESQGDFEETFELAKRVRPDISNVSKFCGRPGTSAAKLRVLDNKIVKRRSGLLSAFCKQISFASNKGMVGKRVRVLVTKEVEGGFSGRSENYKPVLVENACLGEFLDLEIIQSGQSHLSSLKRKRF
ncbi:MAG: tRNA (N(6)-L-threonylcarbamoyladenosine(37)-C(2))-methylthiotransferase [Candidatus Micrarchaeia archaeon]